MESKVVGFRNITGAQCWFNSMLQAFISCDYLINAIEKWEKKDESKSSLGKLLLGVLHDPSSSGERHAAVYEKFIADRKQFASSPQDSSEGLLAFIDCFDKNDLVSYVLESRYYQTVECECGAKSETKDESLIRVVSCDTENISTDDKFSKFLLKPAVEKIEKYKCRACGTQATAIQTKTLKMVGDILIILVKNYEKNIKSGGLAMTLTFGKNHFELVAVVNHTGGHYTANVKRGKKWYCANDSSITEITDPITAFAYILFYQRV